MAAMSIGTGVLLVSAVAALGPRHYWQTLRDGWQGPVLKMYAILAAALAGACLLSLVVARFAPLEFAGYAVQVSFGRDMAKAWYLFWPLILTPCLAVVSERTRETVLRTWLAAFFVLSLIGIQQYFTGWPRPQPIPGNEPYFHATLFLGHHLSVASVLIFPFFTSLAFAVTPKKSAPLGWPRPIWILASVAGAACLFLTFSRNLWGALPVGIALVFLLNLSKKGRFAMLGGLGVLIGAVALVPSIQTRALASIGITDRVELWKANFEFLRLRPLTGTGWHHNLELAAAYFQSKTPGQSGFVGHAHNNVLEVLGSTGLLGFAAWVAWNLWILRRAWSLRTQAWACGVFCALIVLQLNGLTQVNFWESKVLHQLMWVASWLMIPKQPLKS